MAKKLPKPVCEDERVIELAKCVIFAINSFLNKPVYDHASGKMEGWHAWFQRALTEAGYVLVDGGKGALLPKDVKGASDGPRA